MSEGDLGLHSFFSGKCDLGSSHVRVYVRVCVCAANFLAGTHVTTLSMGGIILISGFS